MTLRLRNFVDAPRLAGDWRLASRPPFMRSEVYNQLKRDLLRYSNREISGRSYLIAGHRGVGKTALTLRAIQDLSDELLQASLQDATNVDRRSNLQRPLTVKLHGPSLVEPLVEEDGTVDTDMAHTVLVQIMIGLYRALTREVAVGFAAKAKSFGARSGLNGEEVAAQLLLDLDSGATPAALRSYWARIGRLECGVFWPDGADAVLANLSATDQGLREILAISTAGQAFQVCIGKVTHKLGDENAVKAQNDAKGSAASDGKAAGGHDLKDVIGHVGALVAGGVTGAALWPADHIPAVAWGLAVWLLGRASFSWSFAVSRSRELTASYTFLPDKRIHSLDRDLPVVIDRVRAAGLAPVFVIDELDKVADAPVTIEKIIYRLKHIIADFGFFCFLTNRDYYDTISVTVRDSAFPAVHTYFSERKLVGYGPREFFAYLFDLITSDAPGSEALARTILALYIAHWAKLNFADVVRKLSDLSGDGGLLEVQSPEILQRLDIRLAATVELAVEQVLARPFLALRLEADPGFAQLAYDALYMISRAWEADKESYDTDRTAFAAYLEGRVSPPNLGKESPAAADPSALSTDPAQPGNGDGMASWRIDAMDLNLLISARADLIRYLKDFGILGAELSARRGMEGVPASDLVAPLANAKGLLVATPGRPGVFSFTYDAFGRDLQPGGALTESEAAELIATITAFEELLVILDAQVSHLTQAQLLPGTFTTESLEDARVQLSNWLSDPIDNDLVQGPLNDARLLRAALQEHGARLAAGLSLARLAVFAALHGRPGIGMPAGLAALVRYPVLAAGAGSWSYESWASHHPLFPSLDLQPPVTGAPAPTLEFARKLRAAIPASALDLAAAPEALALRLTAPDSWPMADRATSMAAAWGRWFPRFSAHFAGRPADMDDFEFSDLVEAAGGFGPSAWLYADLSRLTAAQWCEMCLETLPRASDAQPAPRWAVIAALRGLRFEDQLIRALVDAPWPGGKPVAGPEKEQAAEMARGFRGGRKGVLVILDAPLEEGGAPRRRGGPLLYVARSAFAEFEVGLAWLRDLNAFEGIADEL